MASTDAGTGPGTVVRKATMKPRQLTIICPVHNEERVIPLFYERIRPVMDKGQRL